MAVTLKSVPETCYRNFYPPRWLPFFSSPMTCLRNLAHLPVAQINEELTQSYMWSFSRGIKKHDFSKYWYHLLLLDFLCSNRNIAYSLVHCRKIFISRNCIDLTFMEILNLIKFTIFWYTYLYTHLLELWLYYKKYFFGKTKIINFFLI